MKIRRYTSPTKYNVVGFYDSTLQRITKSKDKPLIDIFEKADGVAYLRGGDHKEGVQYSTVKKVTAKDNQEDFIIAVLENLSGRYLAE